MERPILKPPGSPVEQLDTPALVVDLDAMERNVERVHSFFRDRPAKLRPAVHAHKTPAIAHRQLAVEGAAEGVAVVSLSEAEAFAQAGVGDILVTTQIVGASKVSRACALARSIRLTLVADDADAVRALSAGASGAGVVIDALVDVQTHPDRAGLQPADAPVLARVVNAAPGLRFAGVFTAGGPLSEGYTAALRARDEQAVGALVEARRAVETAGLPVRVASYGNSTHDYDVPGAAEGITEVRGGAYALLDANHAPHCPGLEPAAMVLATVNGKPEPGRAVTDCGQKAIGRDAGQPVVLGKGGLTAAANSAEHGLIDAPDGADLDLAAGDQVWLLPFDVSTAFSLHDVVYAVRAGIVEAVWRVGARGAFA
ncbi:MAG: alanine racemase [Chloroflexota bacterium]|nr:alanine racemase [Chloroflexota bacterium]